jgi:hypothetical protein
MSFIANLCRNQGHFATCDHATADHVAAVKVKTHHFGTAATAKQLGQTSQNRHDDDKQQ